LKGRRRKADILPDAAAVAERSMVDLAGEHGAEMHADALELVELRRLLAPTF
jgi:hypothetical protein